jgi:hypothetical protein
VISVLAPFASSGLYGGYPVRVCLGDLALRVGVRAAFLEECVGAPDSSCVWGTYEA